ncbi:MAG: hypothetical protein LZF86_110227 [Nitrospira sp.]|nr:MAG: hypothetical protein LZF86_110227 [Nitrospira sp.]
MTLAIGLIRPIVQRGISLGRLPVRHLVVDAFISFRYYFLIKVSSVESCLTRQKLRY